MAQPVNPAVEKTALVTAAVTAAPAKAQWIKSLDLNYKTASSVFAAPNNIENTFLYGVSKVVCAVAAAFTAILETFQNAAFMLVNGGIFIANGVHSFFEKTEEPKASVVEEKKPELVIQKQTLAVETKAAVIVEIQQETKAPVVKPEIEAPNPTTLRQKFGHSWVAAKDAVKNGGYKAASATKYAAIATKYAAVTTASATKNAAVTTASATKNAAVKTASATKYAAIATKNAVMSNKATLTGTAAGGITGTYLATAFGVTALSAVVALGATGATFLGVLAHAIANRQSAQAIKI